VKQKKPFQKTRDIRLRADRDNKKKANRTKGPFGFEEEDDLPEDEIPTEVVPEEAGEDGEEKAEDDKSEDKP
jgi:hypothetical protein